MVSLGYLLVDVIWIYTWVLIISAVLSWLLAFGIVNRHNAIVSQVGRFCYKATEPALRPIRRFLPLIGGVDLSPLVLILLLLFLRNLLFEYVIYLSPSRPRPEACACAFMPGRARSGTRSRASRPRRMGGLPSRWR